MPEIILHSAITCPECGHIKVEMMPTDACQFFYDCTGCGAVLRPKPGDCCVFCSYASVPARRYKQAKAAALRASLTAPREAVPCRSIQSALTIVLFSRSFRPCSPAGSGISRTLGSAPPRSARRIAAQSRPFRR
jgi:hypothetical protein